MRVQVTFIARTLAPASDRGCSIRTRCVERRLVDRRPDEPAKQQIEFTISTRVAAPTDRIQKQQQCGAQQPLRPEGCSAALHLQKTAHRNASSSQPPHLRPDGVGLFVWTREHLSGFNRRKRVRGPRARREMGCSMALEQIEGEFFLLGNLFQIRQTAAKAADLLVRIDGDCSRDRKSMRFEGAVGSQLPRLLAKNQM
jgi:hypothetical protein